MTSATVRDLRTRFPKVRRLLEDDEEVVITEHGTPVAILKRVARVTRPAASIDYFARLKRRMPKALTSQQRRSLDEADRAER